MRNIIRASLSRDKFPKPNNIISLKLIDMAFRKAILINSKLITFGSIAV